MELKEIALGEECATVTPEKVFVDDSAGTTARESAIGEGNGESEKQGWPRQGVAEKN